MADSFANIAWWQKGVIYQIYPRSFQDSNNDGIGDLQGIKSRLDYLQELGIDALWLSPIFSSPMADFGYDISDYMGIHPIFGTMSDFEELLAAVHERGLKLVLDLVPNHTSDQHPWFLESKSSKDNPKRDWYLWQDAKPDGSPPNNWLAAFGGSAWEWDQDTGQYYYHAFLKEQPDLNWRNPEVQNVMLDLMRFWLDKGVDGFRIDVMWHLLKDDALRDNPKNSAYTADMPECDQLMAVYSTDRPEVHQIVGMMRQVLDTYEERMMIGEIYLSTEKLVAYYGVANQGAHLPSNTTLLLQPWQASALASSIGLYEGSLPKGAWPNWVLGNHDQHRIASRVGVAQSRIAAIMLLTLRGTPIIYYGEEIGMRDIALPFEELKDPQGRSNPSKSKDMSRTPMHWDSCLNAGFSQTKPWISLDNKYSSNNVSLQQQDPASMLSFYKRLIQLRKAEPALQVGNYVLAFSDAQFLAYKRTLEGHDNFLIVVNLTHIPCYYSTPNISIEGSIVLSTDPELEGMRTQEKLYLNGDVGIIIKLDK